MFLNALRRRVNGSLRFDFLRRAAMGSMDLAILFSVFAIAACAAHGESGKGKDWHASVLLIEQTIDGTPISRGSGFVVHKGSGYIYVITNFHVIAHAPEEMSRPGEYIVRPLRSDWIKVFRIYESAGKESLCKNVDSVLYCPEATVTKEQLEQKVGEVVAKCPNCTKEEVISIALQLAVGDMKIDGGDDFAILKVKVTDSELKEFDVLPLLEGKLERREPVLSVGYPANVFSDNTTPNPAEGINNVALVETAGEINAVQAGLYAHDATISGGNSGGPLISEKSNAVAGINTFALINGMSPRAYAISSSRLLTRLREKEIPFVSAKAGEAHGGYLMFFALLFVCGFLGICILVVLVLLVMRRGSGASRPEPAQHPYLIGLTPGLIKGDKFELTRAVTIGRQPAQCQVLFDPNVTDISGVHAEVRYNAQRRAFTVTDLGSRNGTYLDSGQRLEPHAGVELSPDARFYLAERQYTFRVAML